MAGWGREAFGGQYSFVLRKADVPIFDRNNCQTKMAEVMSKKTGPRSQNFKLDLGEL